MRRILEVLLRDHRPCQAPTALSQAVFVPESTAQRQALLIQRRRLTLVALLVRYRTDLLLPQVPKVILVQESLAEPQAQVGKVYRGWVIQKPHAPRLWNAVALPPHHELVEMVAFSAHGNPARVVEVSNRAVAADDEAPPDHRADLAQPDVELVNFGRGGHFAHAQRV